MASQTTLQKTQRASPNLASTTQPKTTTTTTKPETTKAKATHQPKIRRIPSTLQRQIKHHQTKKSTSLPAMATSANSRKAPTIHTTHHPTDNKPNADVTTTIRIPTDTDIDTDNETETTKEKKEEEVITTDMSKETTTNTGAKIPHHLQTPTHIQHQHI